MPGVYRSDPVAAHGAVKVEYSGPDAAGAGIDADDEFFSGSHCLVVHVNFEGFTGWYYYWFIQRNGVIFQRGAYFVGQADGYLFSPNHVMADAYLGLGNLTVTNIY